MNGNCYFADGVNPTLTCNKQEGNRVAIPVEVTGYNATDHSGGGLQKQP